MLVALSVLGEANRFRIVDLLRAGPRPVCDIAKRLRLGQPQVSKHLKVLRETGVVKARVEGQRRLYEICPRPFRELDDWVGSIRDAARG